MRPPIPTSSETEILYKLPYWIYYNCLAENCPGSPDFYRNARSKLTSAMAGVPAVIFTCLKAQWCEAGLTALENALTRSNDHAHEEKEEAASDPGP